MRQFAVVAALILGCQGSGVCDLNDGIHNQTCMHHEDGAYKLKLESSCIRLKLSGALLGDDGAQALADALSADEAPRIKSLDLRDNDIGPAGFSAISRALRLGAGTRLERLDLTGNRIGDDGAKAAAGVMLKSLGLAGLALGGNRISNTGAEAIAAVLPGHGLAQLSLEKNRISDAGAEALAAALSAATDLSELNLVQNSISTRGALALAAGLEKIERRQPFLLGVTKNPAIGEEGLEAIAAARNKQQGKEPTTPMRIASAKGHEEL